MCWLLTVFAAGLAGAATAETASPPPADPLTAIIHTEDAERFAALWRATNGKPTAEQLQRDYVDKGSYGISVFTPGRINDGENLAQRIARHPERYADAVNRCLPLVAAANTDLRSIYLGLKGLIPDAQLPQIYMVVGAGNSGGTADAKAQVLGLEVICAENQTPEKFRQTLRYFFAHETVHTLQSRPPEDDKSPLLTTILYEGAADFIASVITGEQSSPERAAWGTPREQALWIALKADLASPTPPAQRWIYNYQSAPEGWQSDLGYWIGHRIWQGYYDRAADKHQAIRDMLQMNNAQMILERSDYANVAKAAGSL